jgi:hypothetical protein
MLMESGLEDFQGVVSTRKASFRFPKVPLISKEQYLGGLAPDGGPAPKFRDSICSTSFSASATFPTERSAAMSAHIE